MRGIQFVGGGMFIGGAIALVLGLLLGNIEHSQAMIEMAAYVVLGAILGGSAGMITHTVTKGSGRLERIAAAPTKPANRTSAALVVLVAGLGSAAMSLVKLSHAPPQAQGFLFGGLIGGLVGTAFGILMLVVRKPNTPGE